MSTQATTAPQTENHAEQNARNWLESIVEMQKDFDDSSDLKQDEAETKIQESILSVEVRSGWHAPGVPEKATEYCILLTTGGPACRLIGELDRYGQPETARLEYQDWGTPWTELGQIGIAELALLAFAGHFYFGE